MEETRKNLKAYSLLVLAFAALSLIRAIVTLVLTHAYKVGLPAEMPADLWAGAVTVVIALTVLALIPQVYIGLKGIRVANNPDTSKAHIVWAIILLAFSAVALADPIIALISGGNVATNIFSIVDCGLDIIVFGCFVKYANDVRHAA